MKNSQKLLKKIQLNKIIQKSRFQFVLKNILFWTLFILSVIIGGLSLSIILFTLSQAEFDLISHVADSKIELFLKFLPFFWIIICGIFLAFSIFSVRYTKTGYKYPPLLIFGGSVVLSIILGIILFFGGGSEKIEQIFAQNIGIYRGIQEKKFALWTMPKQGFLAGKIIKKDTKMIIEDLNGKKWEINFSNATIRGKSSLKKDEVIKIIGKISVGNIFIAKEIRPWNGRSLKNNQ